MLQSTGRKIFACCLNIQEGRNTTYLSRLDSLCSPHLVKTFTDPVLNRTNLTVVGRAGEIERVVGGLAEFISSTPANNGNNTDNTGNTITDNHGNTTVNHGYFKDHHHIGMMDLIPVHPVSSDATLSEAGTIARKIASHLASLSVPTLLYGAADPQNRSLVQVRKSTRFFSSQDENDKGRGLGVSVVGATPYVMSFNMALNTSNMAIAKGMLPTVRSKSVQAMAYLNTHPVYGTVSEVSCNLTDPCSVEGSPESVLERVRALARERGLEVCHWYSTNPQFGELMDLYMKQVAQE